MSQTVFLASLGCPKNLVDSEVMLGLLTKLGYAVSSHEDEAEIIIVNTCAFIQPAVQESIDAILSLAQNKIKGACRRLIVTGCLAQRYKEQLIALFPEVDAFLGTDRILEIGSILEHLHDRTGTGRPILSVHKSQFIMDEHTPRRRATPFYTAYLKIAEGCVHNCSFCIIPRLRGRLRSRSMESVVSEASRLAEEGVRELVLVAQDTSSYGSDLHEVNTNLPALLRKLAEIKGLDWIRLLYLYPGGISDELLELISSEAKICPYLDIPIQHVSQRILDLMRRPYGRQDLHRLIDRIRGTLPQATLRTSIIVGFPGESKEEFDELLQFVKEVRFEHVGVFPYANEEGIQTSKLPLQLPETVKKQRQGKLMKLQQRISLETNKSRVGTILPVLIEGVSEETELLLKGRAVFQAPDIDGQVYITSGRTEIGKIVPVKITKALPYDLVGEIVST